MVGAAKLLYASKSNKLLLRPIVECDRKKEPEMTAVNVFSAASHSRLLPIFASAIIGVFMIFIVGHLQANALHNAAHDTRHATGFPCH